MQRRSQTRRALKWVGLAASVLTVGAWVISLEYSIDVGWKKSELSLADGQLSLWDVYDPDDAYTGFHSYVETRPRAFRTHGLTWIKGHAYWIGGTRICSVPLWLLLTLGLVPTAILWYRDRRPPKGHCQACGYDLTGNVSGVCPECGMPTAKDGHAS